jgi:hypothetical protein
MQASGACSAHKYAGYQGFAWYVRDTDAQARGTHSHYFIFHRDTEASLLQGVSHQAIFPLCYPISSRFVFSCALQALFRQKLQLCSVVFDFEDPDTDTKAKGTPLEPRAIRVSLYGAQFVLHDQISHHRCCVFASVYVDV